MRPSSKVIARFAIYPVSLCASDQRTLFFFDVAHVALTY